MTTSAVLTLRLDRGTSKRLDKLAAATTRTRSRVASDAIERYLEENAWQVAAIEAGVREAEAGELVTHAQVVAQVRAWTSRKRRK